MANEVLLKKKPMPTIGVSNYTFFKIEMVDGAETYGAPTSLPGLVEIAPTDSGETDVFDADNGAYFNDAYIDKIGHEITNADIPPEVDAAWRGLELKNGVLEVDSELTAPYFGVAWKVEKAGGGYRYVRYYKGTYSFASAVGGKTKPSSGASEKQTATATFTAVKRELDDKFYAYIDDDQLPEGVTKAILEEKWFTDPTWYPGATSTPAE